MQLVIKRTMSGVVLTFMFRWCVKSEYIKVDEFS